MKGGEVGGPGWWGEVRGQSVRRHAVSDTNFRDTLVKRICRPLDLTQRPGRVMPS